MPPCAFRKKGQNLTKKKKEKKQRNKKTNATRTVVVEVDDEESFFNFFKGEIVHDEAELDKMDTEEEDAVNARIDKDYDRGNDIREELIPEAFEHYLGIVEQDEEEPYGCCNHGGGSCPGVSPLPG